LLGKARMLKCARLPYLALALVLVRFTGFFRGTTATLIFALAFAGWRLTGTAPIFLAGAEMALDLLAPLQLGSEIELNAARSFSPQS
jgi:hypothetical protein